MAQGAETRSFTYDSAGRLLSATNLESGTISYNSYDGNGNLTKKTDARGIATNLSYDLDNRVTSKLHGWHAGRDLLL